MNVLVACEYSGVVRDAFREKGHNAWSCDILASEKGESYHYQEDIRNVLLKTKIKWDLLIAHPPCTYMCNSGVSWLHKNPERWNMLESARKFFMMFLGERHGIERVCIENQFMSISSSSISLEYF